MNGFLIGALAGALLMFFLDPERGAYRRNVTRDRAAGSLRDVGDDAARASRKIAADAYGARQKLANMDRDDPPANDAALAQKVMSELFRDRDIPKGSINVDAAAGVVTLRGQVERPSDVTSIEARTRKIDGVMDVENLLHTAGSPAPGRR